MARPRLIQDEQLLQAAREVFVEQGFRATTASIAIRAGVSEGTLFKRFQSKEELFAAAMGLKDYGLWRDSLLEQVGHGEVQRNLEQAALSIVRETDAWARNMIAVFSRGIDPSHNPLLERLSTSTQDDLSALGQYLQRETELGRVRPQDVEVTAITLMGALGAYIHRCAMPGAGEPDSPPRIEAERFVQGVMNVLWPGLRP